MPTDPRDSAGYCSRIGVSGPQAPATLSAWQTGGPGAGTITALGPATTVWPPPIISEAGPASLLPTYTQTGPVPTLPPPEFTGAAASAAPTSSVRPSRPRPAPPPRCSGTGADAVRARLPVRDVLLSAEPPFSKDMLYDAR